MSFRLQSHGPWRVASGYRFIRQGPEAWGDWLGLFSGAHLDVGQTDWLIKRHFASARQMV